MVTCFFMHIGPTYDEGTFPFHRNEHGKSAHSGGGVNGPLDRSVLFTELRCKALFLVLLCKVGVMEAGKRDAFSFPGSRGVKRGKQIGYPSIAGVNPALRGGLPRTDFQRVEKVIFRSPTPGKTFLRAGWVNPNSSVSTEKFGSARLAGPGRRGARPSFRLASPRCGWRRRGLFSRDRWGRRWLRWGYPRRRRCAWDRNLP